MSSKAININDIFFGSEQSKYAGIALFSTIVILCIAILFSSSKIPIEQRIVFVLSILIISIPSVLMSLFELTCIVTGGNIQTRWWCWVLAWVISIVIIIYCIIIIISMILSMSSYDIANERVENDIENSKINKDTANIYAKNIMTKNENDVKNNHSCDEKKTQEEKDKCYQTQKMHEREKQSHHDEENKMQHQQQETPLRQMMQQPPRQLAQPVHHMEVHPRPRMNDISGFDYNDTLSSISEVGDESVNKVQEPRKNISFKENFNMEGYDISSDKFQSY